MVGSSECRYTTFIPQVMDNNTNTSSSAIPKFPLHFRIIKISLYVVIFVTSVFANILVCAVILRRKRMKTVTNYFILNLAVADLTLTCICIPFDIPVQEMHYSWPYGSLMCKNTVPLANVLVICFSIHANSCQSC